MKKTSLTGKGKLFVSGLKGLALLYLSLYLPLMITTYVPAWYQFNCRFHGRCLQMPMAPSELRIRELHQFLLHRNFLSSPWSTKERYHLAESRSLLDGALLIAVVCIVLLLWPAKIKPQIWWPMLNIVIVLMFCLILPFFRFFWTRIFHPLFFDNQMWMNTCKDVSYYIMPSVFFEHTILLILLVSIMLNAILFFYFKRRTKGVFKWRKTPFVRLYKLSQKNLSLR